MIGLSVSRESRRGAENEIFCLKVCIYDNCNGSAERKATDWTMRVRFLSRDEGRGVLCMHIKGFAEWRSVLHSGFCEHRGEGYGPREVCLCVISFSVNDSPGNTVSVGQQGRDCEVGGCVRKSLAYRGIQTP